jgi:hypothetical protein
VAEEAIKAAAEGMVAPQIKEEVVENTNLIEHQQRT